MNRSKKTSLAREFLEKYPWVSKKAVAKQFDIARSTLYRPGKMTEKDRQYLNQILLIMEANPDYGQPRIADALGRNIKLVKRVMKKYGLRTKKRKKRFTKPKDENKDNSGIPNRIKKLSPICPNAIWVGDFTCFVFHRLNIFLALLICILKKWLAGALDDITQPNLSSRL